MDPILSLLENNCMYTNKELAAMLGKSEAEIADKIDEYKKSGVIVGCQAVIDHDKTDSDRVTAFIELKVKPQPYRGFDSIAENIYKYDEVKSLYLMSSSGYDLLVTIEGSTMKEVAYFVAKKLAPIDGVISTSTHFVLTKYKQGGLVYRSDMDERENCN